MFRFACLGLVIAAVAGCQDDVAQTPSEAGASDQYTIVTTCGMVTDIVRGVAGERAEVIGLLGEGVDPHLYKPTRNDRKQMMAADVIFYCGLMLEGKMEEAFLEVADEQTLVVPVGEAIDKNRLRSPAELEGHPDPHVWMDVSLWQDCVREVARQLTEYDPESAAVYEDNAARLLAELSQLDTYARETIATIPTEQRVLVTAHDAFGYFAQAYGLEVKSVQGISTISEAGVKHINDLVDFVVERRIRAIFVESSVSKANITAIIEGAAARDWEVRVGGELFSDAMGPGGTYEGTYVGMIDHNVTTIAAALGGEAPADGMQGKLSPE